MMFNHNIALVNTLGTFIYYPVKPVGLATPSSMKGKLSRHCYFPFIDEGVSSRWDAIIFFVLFLPSEPSLRDGGKDDGAYSIST